MRIVLVGGGTGGHFYPLMATADVLRASQTPLELYYLGPDPYSQADLQKRNIIFIRTPAGKQRRYRSFLNVIDIFRTFYGVFISIGKLFKLYPDVILSKGGYTSVPVVLAAWLLRIPIVIHESDAVAGRANKLASRFARYIAIAYDDAATEFPPEKTALIGIPVRAELLSEPTEEPRAALGITDNLPILLVLGGSSGAERINTLILESLDELLPHYHIIHQTGVAQHEGVVSTAQLKITDQAFLAHYRPVPSLPADALNSAMYAANVVIARAGSTTIHEIAIHGTPAILIPIPEEISHDQRTNAYAYARTGAAVVIEEKNMRDGLLVAELQRIMGDTRMYETMSNTARMFSIKDGAEKLANVVISIGKEHE